MAAATMRADDMNLMRQVARMQLGERGAALRGVRNTRSLLPVELRSVCGGFGSFARSMTQMRRAMLSHFQSGDDATFCVDPTSASTVPIFQVAFAHRARSSQLIAAVDEEGVVSIIEPRPTSAQPQARTSILREAHTKWVAHQNAIFDVVWSYDDLQIVTAAGDLQLCGWDVETQQLRFSFLGHRMSVKCVRQVPHSDFLFASGSRDGNVMLWDTRRSGAKSVGTLQNCHEAVGPSSSSGSFPAGSPSFTSPAGSRKRRKVVSTPRSVTCVDFAANGFELVTGGAVDGCVKFWDFRRLTAPTFKPAKSASTIGSLPTRVVSCSSKGVQRGVASLAFDHTRTKLLVNVLNDSLQVFDCPSSRTSVLQATPTLRCQGHLASSFYVKAAFSPDSDFIVGGSADGAVFVWEATGSRASSARLPLLALKGHNSEVNGVAWNENDFTQIASCSDDGTVRNWQLCRQQLDEAAAKRKTDFHLTRTGQSWGNWEEFCEQQDGVAYLVTSRDEDILPEATIGEPEPAEFKSPVLIRRNSDLQRRSTLPAARSTPSRRRRAQPPSPSPPVQTLLDFWKR